MCGLLGYIGKPKDHKATFDLTNALMDKTEIRGIDATGFWACVNDKNKIFYHKEPVKASEFITREIWKDTAKHKIDLMLGHCRYTSSGSGDEKFNKNNHPHVSKDFRVALVHNGRIPEYPYLKKQYPVSTDCDSEVLLRIFESGEDFHEQEEFLKSQLQKADTSISSLYRVYGLKKIFSEVNYGAMAVALGEHLDSGRALWLFHNEFRPLCLVDLRETMGQFFFCSTQELFRAAVDEAKISQKLIPMNQGVIKLPADWVYHFRMNDSGEIEWEKIKVNRTRKYGYWGESQEEESTAPKGDRLTRSPVEVVTRLDEDEEVVNDRSSRLKSGVVCEMGSLNVKTKMKTSFQGNNIFYEEEEDQNKTIAQDADGITTLCDKGAELLREISTKAQNSVTEGSMWSSEVNDIIDSLTNIVSDIENTKYLIK